MDDFKAADLTDSQLESIIAMERDLQVSTGNEIVLVAYEHESNDGDGLMKPEKNN